jgi:hypothetical protein
MATFYLGLIFGFVIGLAIATAMHIMDNTSYANCVELNAKRGIPEKIGKHWYKLTRIDNEEE